MLSKNENTIHDLAKRIQKCDFEKEENKQQILRVLREFKMDMMQQQSIITPDPSAKNNPLVDLCAETMLYFEPLESIAHKKKDFRLFFKDMSVFFTSFVREFDELNRTTQE